mgnify:CR=1 FL=1
MNEEKIIELLNAGYSIKEIAEKLNLERSKIYYLAQKLNLPLNKPILSGGSKEKKIIKLINFGFSAEDIGKIFKISPVIITKIIKNI